MSISNMSQYMSQCQVTHSSLLIHFLEKGPMVLRGMTNSDALVCVNKDVLY